jgi:hypothetical protein
MACPSFRAGIMTATLVPLVVLEILSAPCHAALSAPHFAGARARAFSAP